MKFFIDTANLADIKKAYKMGVLSGVTTNPSLVAKEGVKFEDRIEEIYKQYLKLNLYLQKYHLMPKQLNR